MKAGDIIILLLVGVALNFLACTSALAISMDAGMSMTGYFSSSWTREQPDITTVSAIEFKTAQVNFSLDPGSVTGDFAWFEGPQPDYTMDPDGGPTQYSGHIGGATSTLSVGNQSFDPDGNGKDFLTWFVDVPSTGSSDTIHFDLVSELVVSRTTTGNTKNLSVYLLGYIWDDDNHWESSLASLNLTISETVVGSNYGYSWAATWASPPASTPDAVPEPSSMLLFGLGLGLTLAITTGLRRKARKSDFSRPI